MKKLAICLCLILFTFANNLLFAQTKLIVGTVVESESLKPISGATIRLVESNKGTYTSQSGKFRLQVPTGRQVLKISSIGYQTQKINLNEKSDSITIKLVPDPILMKSVQVTGDIDANQIIKRAIKRKEENLSRIKTFSGILYSKIVLEMSGSVYGAIDGQSNKLTLATNFGTGSIPSQYQMFLLENFSRNYIDYTKNIDHKSIIQRRQTANLDAAANILAIGEFREFMKDKVRFANAVFTTPLSNDAFDYYNFELEKRTILDDRYVYVINVIPNTSVYPVFKGKIYIVEGTYNLIEVDLKPSDESAISFVKDLNFNQKFEEIKRDIWFPTFFEVTGKAQVNILKGMLDVGTDFKATSIYSDMAVNEALPDSIYKQNVPRITVITSADSTNNKFWEQNSLRDISPKELNIYSTVDSLVTNAKKDSIAAEGFNYSYMPEFGFNRTSSVLLGLNLKANTGDFEFEGMGAYSFGQKKPYGYANLSYNIDSDDERSKFDITFGIYSNSETMGTDDTYPKIVHSIMSLLTHKEYYNFFKESGWSITANYENNGLEFWTEFEQARHFLLKNSTDRSIFQEKRYRSNPAADPGNYNVISFGSIFDGITITVQRNIFQYAYEFNAFYGQNHEKSKFFRGAEAKLRAFIPTFYTGYAPMSLDIDLHAGYTSKSTPLQYMYLMQTGFVFLGQNHSFISAPLGRFGGSEYASAAVHFNTQDLWWRALGLPLYEGRGLELIFSGLIGKYNNFNNKIYSSTGNKFYAEAGFGLDKIPTFVSNLIYLKAEFRWGVESLAKDRFGFALWASLPF